MEPFISDFKFSNFQPPCLISSPVKWLFPPVPEYPSLPTKLGCSIALFHCRPGDQDDTRTVDSGGVDTLDTVDTR